MKRLLQYGNHKLPTTTAIFNMSSAKRCPARKLNLCPVIAKGIQCYARKSEKCRSMGYDMVCKYRNRQEKYWRETHTFNIIGDLIRTFEAKRVKINLFRFNESGDFHNQLDVEKLSLIAEVLKKRFKITTYGYTSRSDLDFSRAKFLVKGSEHNAGNNGKVKILDHGESVPKGYYLCPGSCKICNMCSRNNKRNIAIRRH